MKLSTSYILHRSYWLHYISLIITVLTIVVSSCSDHVGDDCEYLTALDSLIEQEETIDREKLFKIAKLVNKRQNTTSETDRYLVNSLLFDEFSTYKVDSAMKYINENIDISRRAGNLDWEVTCKIAKAELLTGAGLLTQANQLMESIDRTSLPHGLAVKYYGQLIYLYSHLGNFTGGKINDYYIRERAYKDSMMAIINPDHPEYLWYKGWDVLGTDKDNSEVIEALRGKLEKSGFSARQDAKDAYILAKLYEEEDDSENYRKYMALSGIADVRTANAEIASLEELAKIMFDQGDIDRAYAYINYSLDKAISYPNRVRAYGITTTLEEINNAYQERNHLQQRRTRQSLIAVGLLAVILVAAISFIFVQNSRLKRQRLTLDNANKDLNNKVDELSETHRQLNEANRQLTRLNDSLKAANYELNEANYVKEEYIGYVFTLCSNYIGKLEEQKRRIHIKVMAKQYKDIADETADFDMKSELKEFYQSFDSIFLHIYPNFVSDFNALLQPDKRIALKEGELLNTELRIYALVRLGITDSVKIAEFLHCSPQTVYNNRFKVRNKAIISKKEFADCIRTLGTYQKNTF